MKTDFHAFVLRRLSEHGKADSGCNARSGIVCIEGKPSAVSPSTPSALLRDFVLLMDCVGQPGRDGGTNTSHFKLKLKVLGFLE